LWVGIGSFTRFLLVVWATTAIYYSNLPWAWSRQLLAAVFLAFSIWTLWWSRTVRMRLTLAALFLVVVVWFITIPPSHDRHWRPEAAVMPRAIIDGDRIHILNYRNFLYRSRSDFTVRYEERDVSLAHLIGVDFYVSYFMPGPVAHTFVSFIFDDVPPVCISIETRPEVGESFAPIPSMFKQFELIYVVGDENDIVGVRANHRKEKVFLYRIQTSADSARRLFLVYLERINELADRPEWYHLLSNSCTINIVRYANAVGRAGGFEIRHLLNGLIDRYLYAGGWLDTTLPFEELRRRSQINDAARGAENAPDFSDRIRASLPGTQPRASTASSTPPAVVGR
jgi:hypothetical protein